MDAKSHIQGTEQMHVCPDCHAPFLQPAEWRMAGAAQWLVSRVCPNCDWSGEGVFGETAVDQYDIELDRGAEELLADLEAFSRGAMTEYVETFVVALDAGQILPEDF